MYTELLQQLRTTLHQNANPSRAESAQHYFKEGILTYGMTNGEAYDIGNQFKSAFKALNKTEAWKCCEALFASQMQEECLIACKWIMTRKREFKPEDWEIFKSWINRYLTNWATIDTFCTHTMGFMMAQFPEQEFNTLDWTHSDNRWMKRAAAVSYIKLSDREELYGIQFEIALRLMTDTDDMVQKGYGWMLKEIGEHHPQLILDFVLQHEKEMPRTAFRYAIEKLPKSMRDMAMKKG
jgi:3-methyladenine DNA glycosylase AlkD